MQRTPRSANQLSDLLANEILDTNLDCKHYVHEDLPIFTDDVIIFAINSDGASRGNTGASSCAAVVYVYVLGTWRMAAYSAMHRGVGINVRAEFEGAVLAMHLFLTVLSSLPSAIVDKRHRWRVTVLRSLSVCLCLFTVPPAPGRSEREREREEKTHR